MNNHNIVSFSNLSVSLSLYIYILHFIEVRAIWYWKIITSTNVREVFPSQSLTLWSFNLNPVSWYKIEFIYLLFTCISIYICTHTHTLHVGKQYTIIDRAYRNDYLSKLPDVAAE